MLELDLLWSLPISQFALKSHPSPQKHFPFGFDNGSVLTSLIIFCVVVQIVEQDQSCFSNRGLVRTRCQEETAVCHVPFQCECIACTTDKTFRSRRCIRTALVHLLCAASCLVPTRVPKQQRVTEKGVLIFLKSCPLNPGLSGRIVHPPPPCCEDKSRCSDKRLSTFPFSFVRDL